MRVILSALLLSVLGGPQFIFRVPTVSGSNPLPATRLPLGDTTLPNSIWAGAGVEGGIPYRTSQCGSTINSYTGTSATINTAISSCSSGGGGVVVLNSGTFSLSTTVVMKSNVTLRGQGVGTILSFTNMNSSFFWGAGEVAIEVIGSYNSTGYGTDPGLGSAPASQIKSWSGTGGSAGVYTQGATVLNLTAAPTGLANGNMLTLFQQNDSNASLPRQGYFVSAKTGASAAISINGGLGDAQFSYQQQRVRVTNISGNNVTVTPGLFLPTNGTWRTGQTPQVAWQGGDIQSAGIEDLLIRTTGYSSTQWALVQFFNATNCWLTRVAMDPKEGTVFNGVNGNSDGVLGVVQVWESRHISVLSNWIDRSVGGGFGSSTAYGIRTIHADSSAFENNIFDTVTSPFIVDTGTTGSVFAFNYEAVHGPEGGILFHEGGSNMNLVEGNRWLNLKYIPFHGNNNFTTMLRNYSDGADAGIQWGSYGRYIAALGNILAQTVVYKALPTDSTKYSRWDPGTNGGACIRLGYAASTASAADETGVAIDQYTWQTAMLWGNYCAFTGAVTWNSAEVPSTDPDYPVSVPSTQTVPTSYYRSSAPLYFTLASPISTTVTWPPIGPEVTGGSYQGGRVYKIPAQLVYENAAGAMTSFNPALYGR